MVLHVTQLLLLLLLLLLPQAVGGGHFGRSLQPRAKAPQAGPHPTS